MRIGPLVIVVNALVLVSCSSAGRSARSGSNGNGSDTASVESVRPADRGGAEHEHGSATTPAPLADADKLPLDGSWHISIRSVESGDDEGSQYGYYVRISPTGEIFETVRHEVKSGAAWKEEATPRGWIRQLDARTLRIKWRPEDPHDYKVQSRDSKSFVIVRHWEIEKPSREDWSSRPYPRGKREDRSFVDTWTFERKTAPGTQP